MTPLIDDRPAVPTADPAQIRMEPVLFHRAMLDGTWWPRSGDPIAELPGLVRALDERLGPVVRLLLSAAGWTRRPHQIVLAGRVVSLGYFCGQPADLLTAILADGSTRTLLVRPETTVRAG
jgi:hypothetical protein